MQNMNEEDILMRLKSTVGLGRGTLLKLQDKFDTYCQLVFERSEQKESCPNNFSSFLTKPTETDTRLSFA